MVSTALSSTKRSNLLQKRRTIFNKVVHQNLLVKFNEKINEYVSFEELEKINHAFDFAHKAHKNQKRLSGEPYIIHPLTCAILLANLHLDPDTICACLLHDVIEDTKVNHKDISKKFGETVANLVDGVTKLERISVGNSIEHSQAENLQKMCLAMTQDIRVIFIKLADRIHNLRTLDVIPREKQKRIIKETEEIYVAIASKLGLNEARKELLNLCFKFSYPLRNKIIEASIKKFKEHNKKEFKNIKQKISKILTSRNIKNFKIHHIKPSCYQLYRKMQKMKISFRELSNIYSIKILTDSIDDCYRILGALHTNLTPVMSHFDDYIAIPKHNGYQSLHTLLFGNDLSKIQVKIRTKQMHEIAEFGIANYFNYKLKDDASYKISAQKKQEDWVKQIIELHHSVNNPLEFIDNAKEGLFPQNVYVFTPKGDIKNFPFGSTVIDFAYSIHTSLGHSATGCLINDKNFPINTVLKNGQIVFIKNKTNSDGSLILNPNPRWLNFAKQAATKNKIRSFLANLNYDKSVEMGYKLLHSNLDKNINYEELESGKHKKFKKLLKFLKVDSWEELLAEIGTGKRFPNFVNAQLVTFLNFGEKKQEQQPVVIDGTEGLETQFSLCCHPIPGDEIIGKLQHNKGIEIHRQNCKKINKKNYSNIIPIEWSKVIDKTQKFTVSAEVISENKIGALVQIAGIISSNNCNILSIYPKDSDNQIEYSNNHYNFLVSNKKHFEQVMKELKKCPAVLQVYRI